MPDMKTLKIGNKTYDIRDSRIGNLADLNTTDKDSVVDAINETLTRTGPTDQQVQAAVDDYLDTHPAIGGTFTNEAKNALIALLEKVAYIDNDGQTLLDALAAELFAVTVTSISAVFTQGGAVIYDTDSLDTLKQYLVVTANYSDGTSAVVNTYTLSGTLTVGTSTITASYGGQTDTFTVNVSSVYTLYDYIKYTGTDYSGSSSALPIMILTAEYDDLNSLIIDFDFSASKSVSSAMNLMGGHHTSGSGNNYVVSFYGNTSTKRVSCFSHGTALGINDNPNVAVGSIAHVNLNPGSATPSKLTVDSLNTTGSWTTSQVVKSPLGYFGQYDRSSASLKAFAEIGVLKLYDLSNNLVGEYHPAKRTTDNVLGIYDSVTGNFYTASTVSYATVGNANCKYAVGNWS